MVPVTKSDGPLTLALLRDAVRPMQSQEGEQVRWLEISPSAEGWVRDMPNFIMAEKYGGLRAEPNEIGCIESCRVRVLPENVYTEDGGLRHFLTVTTTRKARIEATEYAFK